MIPATAVGALTVLALTALPASADGGGGGGGGGRSIVRSELMGSMPAPASPQIAGVNPGAAPWVNGPSRVRVRVDGRVKVTIRGLVIPPPTGTGVNPITSVVATLVCGDTVRASTAPFALSSAGDGSTTQVVDAPGECADPVALIQPAANRAVYIASTLAVRR
jgi:hypothetical protein